MPEQQGPIEGEILFYSTPNGTVRVEVFFEGETFWLTQARMAELFGTTRQAIGYHLTNIFETNELDRAATSKEILLVRKGGEREVALLERIRAREARPPCVDSLLSDLTRPKRTLRR